MTALLLIFALAPGLVFSWCTTPHFATQSPGACTFSQPHRYLTSLRAPSPSGVENRAPMETLPVPSSGSEGNKLFVNTPLLSQLLASQLIIAVAAAIVTRGSTLKIIAESIGYDHPAPIALGLLCVLPLVALNRFLETSESSLFAEINLSTNLFVYSVFGPRRQPVVTAIVSLGMCLLVGTVEETVFRGQLFPIFNQWISAFDVDLTSFESGLLAALLSSAAFAAGHLNLRGGLSQIFTEEAQVLFALQLFGAMLYCAMYVVTGDLTVPVMAHAAYDFNVFFGTHMRLTSQLAYARGLAKSLESNEEAGMEKLRYVFYLMDIDQDGYVSRKELRIGLYSFGVELPRSWSGGVFGMADKDKSGQLDFNEFVEFVKNGSGEASNALKRSILGVRS